MACQFLRRPSFLKLLNNCASLNLRRNKHQLDLKPEGIYALPEKISTLYVPGRHGGDVYQIVKPIIDVSFIVENIQNIIHTCQLRGLELNLEGLVVLLRDWEVLRNEYTDIVEKERECQIELNRLKSLNLTSDCESLQKQQNEIVECLKAAKVKLHDIEDIVLPIIQKIPNSLEPGTPLGKDTVDMSVNSPCLGFPAASHVEIGRNMAELEFSNFSPTSYYLVGSLSELELAAQMYFCDKLKDFGFSHLSCIDFCKSFIVEAIGSNPHSMDDCIPLRSKNSREIGQKQILTGGASFETFCSYFTNMNVGKSTLSAKYFSQGRRYNAKYRLIKSPNLFSVVQSNNIHCLVLCDNEGENVEFDALFENIVSCYSSFKIPFRTVSVAANNLNPTESRRKQLELWSLSQKKFITVAYVSQHGDFVSKRLHITYGLEHAVEGYCSIVEGVAVNLSVLIGCVMENYQNPNQKFNFKSELMFLQDYV